MYESRLIETSMISASTGETTTRNSQGRKFNRERRCQEGHRPQYRCPQRSTRGSGIRPRPPVHRRFRHRPVSARSTRTSDRLRCVSQRAGLAGPLQPARRHRRDGIQTKEELIANALHETSVGAKDRSSWRPARPGDCPRARWPFSLVAFAAESPDTRHPRLSQMRCRRAADRTSAPMPATGPRR